MRTDQHKPNDRHNQNSFSEIPDFDAAMRKLITVPKEAIANRERERLAAKKKAAKKR